MTNNLDKLNKEVEKYYKDNFPIIDFGIISFISASNKKAYIMGLERCKELYEVSSVFFLDNLESELKNI